MTITKKKEDTKKGRSKKEDTVMVDKTMKN